MVQGGLPTLGLSIEVNMARTQFVNKGTDSLAVATQESNQFALDTFTEPNGTGIGSRLTDSGHNWFQHPVLSPTAPGAIQSGEAYGGNTSSFWYLDAEPDSADYSVSVAWNNISSTSVPVGILARQSPTVDTGYFLQRNNSTISLQRRVNGTGTGIGTNVSRSLEDCVAELRVEGSSIEVFIIEDSNGEYITPSGGTSPVRQPCISAIDSNITAKGRPGIQLGNGGPTSRTRADDFTGTLVESQQITVNDGSKFPSTGDFTILVSSDTTYEIMLCTSRTGNVLTVERAKEGTASVAHPPGSIVTLTVTPENIDRFLREETLLWQTTKLAPFQLRDADGNKLTSTDFGWVNQSTSTVTDDGSGISLNVPNPGSSQNELRILTRTRDSASAAFDLIVGFNCQLHRFNPSSTYFGVGVRDNTSGEIWFIAETVKEDAPATAWADRLIVTEYSDENSFSQNFFTEFWWWTGREIKWHRLNYDGTTLKFYTSTGVFWQEIHSRDPATDSFDIDQLVFLGNAGDNATTQDEIAAHIFCWQES